MANQSIKNAFQTFWYKVVNKLNNYATIESLDAHINDKNNPHELKLDQLGVNATATELNYMSGATENIQKQLNDKSNSSHGHEISDVAELENALTNAAEGIKANATSIAEKSQVQIITSDGAEKLTTLKIHKLTQEEYEQAISDGSIDENALYLTPDEEIDLSGYATEEYVNNAIATIPTPNVSGQIESHNTSVDAHKDIRTLIENLSALIGDTEVSSQISAAIQEIIYPVDSVNGKTGAVTLTASDVGALSVDTVIPSVEGFASEEYVDNSVAQKSQIQIITWEDDD